jgi:hypothetical protein
VDESVLLVYVTNSPSMFSLNAEEIIYLSDIGVSSEVVTAMLNHDQALKAAPAQSVWAPAPEAPATNEATAAAEIAPQQATAPPAPVQEAAPAPAVQPTYSTFYQTLAPYGTWVEVDGYGLVWQPTVVVSRPSWRPYFDNGHWVYSDYGWYWASDYSWGWAPFHYGRWFRHHHLGWCWYPSYTWGPSWVSWRYTDGYCGWAPLPPCAVYRPGFGLTYWGRHVGVTFGFGLGFDSFSFVSWGHFRDRHVHRHYVHHDHARRIYHDSVVSTRIVGNRGHVFNQGLSVDHVSRVTRTPVQKVAVRETGNLDGRGVRGDRLAADGKSLTVYRPRFPEANSTRPTRTEPVTTANRSGVVRNLSSETAPAGALKPVPATLTRVDRTASTEGRRPVPAATLANPGDRLNRISRVGPVATQTRQFEARETATQTRAAANPFARTETAVSRGTRPAAVAPPQPTAQAQTARPGTRTPAVAPAPARPAPNVTQNWQTSPSTPAPIARNEVASRSPWNTGRQSTAPATQAAPPSRPQRQPSAPTQTVPRVAEPPRATVPMTPRFAPAPAQRYNSTPAPSYQAPARPAQTPRYNPPAYNAPQATPQREYRAATPSYQAPRQTYQAPAPSYQAPSRSYEAPARSHTPAPAAPSYSAPSRPSPSYSAPSRPSPSSESRPSSSGESRGGRGGWTR